MKESRRATTTGLAGWPPPAASLPEAATNENGKVECGVIPLDAGGVPVPLLLAATEPGPGLAARFPPTTLGGGPLGQHFPQEQFLGGVFGSSLWEQFWSSFWGLFVGAVLEHSFWEQFLGAVLEQFLGAVLEQRTGR